MSKRFALKLALYVLPFAIGFGLLTGTLVYIGESMPLGWVVSLQQRGDVLLYGQWYGERNQQYKASAANARQPEVLAVGSSRILQFRDSFLNRNPRAFYNAAAPGWYPVQSLELLESLDDAARPQVLILAIDPPWFNDAYDARTFPDDVSDFENLFLVNRGFLQDVLDGETFDREGFDRVEYLRRTEPGSGGVALGMKAIRDGHGFRADGSEQYGDFLVAQWLWQPQQRDRHMDLMRAGEEMYIYGDTLSEAAFQELVALLDYTRDHDIVVIGFLPPYMPSLWAEMMARGNHTYMIELVSRLESVFSLYDYPLFDFSDGAVLGLTDEDFFDGWHVSELGSLLIYIRMLDVLPDILGPYSDLENLRQVADSASSTWDIFGIDR